MFAFVLFKFTSLISFSQITGVCDKLAPRCPGRRGKLISLRPIPLAYAIPDPGAVVVVSSDTSPAVPAMFGPQWLIEVAALTVTQLDESAV